jgi:hypothetical protein
MKRTCVVGLLLVNFLYGCIFPSMWGKPGYVIMIESTFSNKKEMEELKGLIIRLNFHALRPEEVRPDKSVFVNYLKEIPKVNVTLGHKETEIEGKPRIRFFLTIGNIWEGKAPALRSQIDEVGNILYNFLVEKVGRENVKIDRLVTDPPF